MPVQTTYPGVYIVEQASGSHVISGVSTSVTAFVGAARQGPSDTPTAIGSYADFVRQFGDPVDATRSPDGLCGRALLRQRRTQADRRAGARRQCRGRPAGPAGPVNGITVTLTARSRGAWANGTGSGRVARAGIFVAGHRGVANPGDRFDLVVSSWRRGTGAATIGWPARPGPSCRCRRAARASSPPCSRRARWSPPRSPAPRRPPPWPGPRSGRDGRPGGVAGLAGRTLRIAVDQGAADRPCALARPANPADSHTAGDVVAVHQRCGERLRCRRRGRRGQGGADQQHDRARQRGGGRAERRGGREHPARARCRGGRDRGVGQRGRPACGCRRRPGSPAGDDGSDVDAAGIVSPPEGQGMLALDVLNFPRFNLLCLPGVTTADFDA